MTLNSDPQDASLDGTVYEEFTLGEVTVGEIRHETNENAWIRSDSPSPVEP